MPHKLSIEFLENLGHVQIIKEVNQLLGPNGPKVFSHLLLKRFFQNLLGHLRAGEDENEGLFKGKKLAKSYKLRNFPQCAVYFADCIFLPCIFYALHPSLFHVLSVA